MSAEQQQTLLKEINHKIICGSLLFPQERRSAGFACSAQKLVGAATCLHLFVFSAVILLRIAARHCWCLACCQPCALLLRKRPKLLHLPMVCCVFPYSIQGKCPRHASRMMLTQKPLAVQAVPHATCQQKRENPLYQRCFLLRARTNCLPQSARPCSIVLALGAIRNAQAKGFLPALVKHSAVVATFAQSKGKRPPCFCLGWIRRCTLVIFSLVPFLPPVGKGNRLTVKHATTLCLPCRKAHLTNHALAAMWLPPRKSSPACVLLPT